MQIGGACCFCNLEVETHLYLFFACSYSTTVWELLMGKNLVQGMPNTLENVLAWFNVHAKGKILQCISLKCSLAAGVYGLWRKRNFRIFQGSATGHDQVAAGIVAGIRDFLN
ncbi:hypothetical protein RHGRI_014278 [Rhododendron griersonianum]|uniref:Reverse transcriptase zinc-binding domain-containing protein n=1 Tax=Rhododendron griersonianum TaxID=479676 RepID=A0AAV6K956_9ERIC|nr:hypothetical protein RHGRI_014278 [Rhododendron griersonianum]